MYKNLSPSALGISGRQSELVELALTFGFRSVEVNIDDLVRKAQKQGVEHAARFLASGQLTLGCFDLPIEWRGTEEAYQASLKELDGVAQVVAAAGGTVCRTPILPASDTYPYHDNFELHRKRLTEMGEILDQHKISIGLSLMPLPADRAEGEFQFIYEADGLVALIKSITATNVGLYLDCWDWHLSGGTIAQLHGFGDRIAGVVIADAAEGLSAETATDAQRLLPGDGVIDITGLIRQLAEQDYSGPITLGVSPECFQGTAREATVKKCTKILDELLAAASGDVADDVEESTEAAVS